jgi:imidazolonepropionase-like amidohydrolase
MSGVASERARVVLRADRLLADAESALVADGAVLAEGGRILAVGPFAELSRQAGEDALVVEFGDSALLPGMVGCHVHLAMDAGPTATSSELTATDAEPACRMADSARRSTHRAAAACGLSTVTGRPAAGLAADVLAVPGDPTEDLSVLHRPACALARGRLHWCPTPAVVEPDERRAAAQRIHRQLTVGSGRGA